MDGFRRRPRIRSTRRGECRVCRRRPRGCAGAGAFCSGAKQPHPVGPGDQTAGIAATAPITRPRRVPVPAEVRAVCWQLSGRRRDPRRTPGRWDRLPQRARTIIGWRRIPLPIRRGWAGPAAQRWRRSGVGGVVGGDACRTAPPAPADAPVVAVPSLRCRMALLAGPAPPAARVRRMPGVPGALPRRDAQRGRPGRVPARAGS